MSSSPVDASTMANVDLNLHEPRYSQDTYMGRVKHFMDVTDVRTLLVSEEKLEEAKTLVADYKAGKIPEGSVNGETLWQAKKIVDSTVHPDTGETIFLPFRMSAFVPMNILITVGMLIPNPSIPTLIFWQWVNQSLNVGINFANANKSTPLSTGEVLTAYAGATTASCSIAVGLNQWVKRTSRLTNAQRASLGRFVPFVAVAAANFANVFLMRSKELTAGVAVKDEDGKVLGKSKRAGLFSLTACSVSRVATASPALTLVPVAMTAIENKFPSVKANWLRGMPIQCTLLGLCFAGALPFAIAIFPQTASLPVSSVEPEFQGLKRKDGSPVQKVTFNKGL
eukprot:Clim_evm15s157 gene=Clim_evmTU15s157